MVHSDFVSLCVRPFYPLRKRSWCKQVSGRRWRKRPMTILSFPGEKYSSILDRRYPFCSNMLSISSSCRICFPIMIETSSSPPQVAKILFLKCILCLPSWFKWCFKCRAAAPRIFNGKHNYYSRNESGSVTFTHLANHRMRSPWLSAVQSCENQTHPS